MAGARRRVPQMEDVKVTRMINGPEAFTPDNEFCLGETEVGGLFVAAGFCAHGLAGAGGIGRVMAEWISEGEPSLDLWHMDVRRFGGQYRSPGVHARAGDARPTRATTTSAIRATSARPAGRCGSRRPPAGTATTQAAFGEKSGWERVNWYESNAAAGDESLRPRGWAGQALVARDRRGARRLPRRRGDLRRVVVREARDRGSRRRRSCSSTSATTAWRAASGRSPTPRC